MKPILIVPFLLIVSLVCGQTSPLFKITQNDKAGYVNSKGDVVIKPSFFAGNDFSEGLAAVRLNGYYGFIDETGRFAIKAKYDYANSFYNGIAVVYKDGMPFFIDKKGEAALPPVYKNIFFLNDRKAIVTTITDKQGIIDIHSKKLVVDTQFLSVQYFDCGVMTVKELEVTGKGGMPRIGVIDTTGKFLVPFGKYDDIKAFIDGFAIVHIESTEKREPGMDGVIDTKGGLVFERLCKDYTYIDGDFYNGYAKMNLYKYWIPERNGHLGSSEKNYGGYINLKGEIVFDDTTYLTVTDFSERRAFIRSKGDDYILVDKSFKRVGNAKFREIINEKFQKGYAIVETKTGYGIIDTLGDFVVQPKYEEIDEVGIIDDYFFFSEDGEDDQRLSGVANLNGKVITKAQMQYYDRSGFHNGILKAIVSNQLTYIDRNGRFVWQEKVSDSKKLRRLNIDYMNRSYFMAYSTKGVINHGKYLGWAVSDNVPQKISNRISPENKLAVTIDITQVDTFDTRFSGFGLFVSNTTPDTVRFNAQDSRLYMKLQAQDSKDQWRDIEYMPNSWCGNSYHDIALEPNAFWRFVIPDYEGEVETKIRAELKYIDKDDPEKNKVVYSNEINGSINPAQFWNKKPYYPRGYMDPYNE